MFRPAHRHGIIELGYPGLDTIYGITSFGPNCSEEKSAGVYTNIPFFYDWIKETIKTQASANEVTDYVRTLLDFFRTCGKRSKACQICNWL